MTVISMSRKELARLQVVIDFADGRISAEIAAELMGIQRRQVYRLLDAFRRDGANVHTIWYAARAFTSFPVIRSVS